MCMQGNGRSSKLNTEYVLELLKLNDKRALYDQLSEWDMPKYPINGHILMENGCPAGKKMKVILTKLANIWSENNFSLDKDELLKFLPDVLSEMSNEESVRKKAKREK